jgi:hypothetical protein
VDKRLLDCAEFSVAYHPRFAPIAAMMRSLAGAGAPPPDLMYITPGIGWCRRGFSGSAVYLYQHAHAGGLFLVTRRMHARERPSLEDILEALEEMDHG